MLEKNGIIKDLEKIAKSAENKLGVIRFYVRYNGRNDYSLKEVYNISKDRVLEEIQKIEEGIRLQRTLQQKLAGNYKQHKQHNNNGSYQPELF